MLLRSMLMYYKAITVEHIQKFKPYQKQGTLQRWLIKSHYYVYSPLKTTI